MGSIDAHDERQGLFSRLPEDPEYWRGMTERIVNDARPTLARFSDERTAWWSEMARFSKFLAVGATAAVISALLLLPRERQAEQPSRVADAYGLTPRDPLAATLVSERTPPWIGTVIAVGNTEKDQ